MIQRATIPTLLVLTAAAAACSAPIPEGRFSCTIAEECPSGWSCIESRCWSSISKAYPPDATFAPPDAEPIDSGFDDAGDPIPRDAEPAPDAEESRDAEPAPDAEGPPPDAGCTATSCDDLDPCTIDRCLEGSCTTQPIPGCCNGDNDCNDGDVCTTDACNMSTHTCSGAPISGCCVQDSDCTDSSACTATSCDLSTNRCVVTSIPNCCSGNGDCDDADPCTTDTCDVASGRCNNVAIADCCRTAGDCNDGNTCTADSCTASNRCLSTRIPGCCLTPSDCNDGDLCTTDVCNGMTYTCTNPPVTCNDGNACTNDSCASGSGCVFTPNTAPCNDNNACTENDACSGGVCGGGTPVTCNDANICTDDSCVPATGCAYTPNTAPCDDMMFCNGPDMCQAGSCGAHAGDPCAGTPSTICEETSDMCEACGATGQRCCAGGTCTSSITACMAGICS